MVERSIDRVPVVDFTAYEDVDECFHCFTAAMFLILSGVDFTLLRGACLENVNILGGVTLPEDLKNNIKATMDLSKLFDVLRDSPYWNWMNIKMLTKMASASLLPAASKLIQQYKNKIYSRKLIDILPQIPKLKIPDNYYAIAKEKWDKNLEDVLVKDLVKKWSDIEEIFDVKEPTVLLDHITTGCIEVYWLIPMDLVEHICQSIKTKISMLHEYNILYFEIEGHLIKSQLTSTVISTSAGMEGMFFNFMFCIHAILVLLVCFLQ